MPLDAPAEQGLRVVLDVEDRPVVGGPGEVGAGAGEGVGQLRAGRQVAEAQGVLAPADGVLRPRQQGSVVADLVVADLEEVQALAQAVAVEQHLLGGVDAALAAGVDGVLAALLVAGVVPVAAVPGRHRGIVLLDAAHDLVVEAAGEVLQRRHVAVEPGVLGPEVVEHRRVLPAVVAQPVPGIGAVAVGRGHRVRALGGGRRLAGIAAGGGRGGVRAGDGHQAGEEDEAGKDRRVEGHGWQWGRTMRPRIVSQMGAARAGASRCRRVGGGSVGNPQAAASPFIRPGRWPVGPATRSAKGPQARVRCTGRR